MLPPAAPVPMTTHLNAIEPGKGRVNGPARTRLGRAVEAVLSGVVLVAMVAGVAAQAAAAYAGGGGATPLLAQPLGSGPANLSSVGYWTGSFVKATVTGNQDITLPTGCPDLTAATAGTWAVHFWTGGTNNVASGTWGSGIHNTIGFTTGAAQSYSCGWASDDAVGTSNTGRRVAAKAITFPDSGGSTSLAECDFVSFPTSTTMRVNWTTNNGALYAINFTVITGLTNALVGTTTGGGSTGNLAITGVGFSPDLVMHATVGTLVMGTSGTHGYLGFGVVNKHGQQWANGIWSSDAQVANTVTSRYQQADACLATVRSDSVTERVDLEAQWVSMDAGGYTINVATNNVGATWPLVWLCMKGVSSRVGTFAKVVSPTSAQTVTSKHGFAPVGALFSSWGYMTQGTALPNAVWEMGSYDGTNSRASMSLDADAQATTLAQALWLNDAPIVASIGNSTTAKGTVTYTTSSFTVTYSVNDANPNEFGYVLFGPAGTSTSPQAIFAGNNNAVAADLQYGNQKKNATLSTGRLVSGFLAGAGAAASFAWSDDGITWTNYANDLLGPANFSVYPYVDSGGVERLVVIFKQTGTGGGRTSGEVYISIGTFNAGRTTLTWTSTVLLANAAGWANWDLPDVVANAEGTGGAVHAVVGASNNSSLPWYARHTIDNTGAQTAFPVNVSLTATPTPVAAAPSIDQNGSTKDIYVAWNAGASGAGKGIRFRRATYSAGAWTFQTEQTVDSTYYLDASVGTWAYSICRWDAGRSLVLVGGLMTNGTTPAWRIYDSSDFSTFTNRVTTSEIGDSGGWAIDGATGNVYIVGQNNAYTDLGYYPITRSGSTLSLGTFVSTHEGYQGGPRYVHPWYSGNVLRWTYGFGSASPYSIYYDKLQLAAAPAAPTLTSPASGTYMDVSGGVTFQATYNSTDGTNQNAYALRAKVGAGSYVYWNASTALWQGTIVWNTISTAPSASWSIAVPTSATIANGATLNWSFASQESAASIQGPFAADSTIVMQATPGLTVTAPTGTVTGSLTPRVTWTASPPAGAAQTQYRMVIYTPAQYGAGGFVAGTSTGYYDTGVVGSANQFFDVPTGANLQAGVTYRFYVQITETGGETSTWQFSSATFTVDPPADPTITATPGTDGTTGAPRTAVVVQGRDNLLTTEQASFEAGTAAGWAAGANTAMGANGFANLLTANQSSLETDTSGWAVDFNCAIARDATQAFVGSASLKLTASASTTAMSATTTIGTGGVPVVPGVTYTAIAYFKSAATVRGVRVKVAFFDSGGVQIGSSIVGATVNDATTGWTQVYAVVTSPAGAAFAAVKPEIPGAVVAAEVHWVDAISLAQGVDLRWALGGTTPPAMSVDGIRSMTLVATAAAVPNANTPTGTSGLAVTPSQQYTALASFRAQATPRACVLAVFWYQASGAASAIRPSDSSTPVTDSTSAWTQATLTVTAPADAAFAALAVQTQAAVAANEEHFVDNIDIGPGSSTVWTRGGLNALTTGFVQFSDDGGVTWTTMRTSGAAFPFPSQTLTLYDYEAPPGLVRQYRAQVQAAVGGGATILSNFVSTSATGTTPSQWVISDPTDPTSGILFHSNGNPSRQLATKASMHAPFGRARQVKVSDGTKGWSGRLPARTTTTAAQVKLEALLARNVVLLVQSPEGGGRQWYANIDSDPSLTQIGTTLGTNVLGGVAGRGTTKMPHTDNVISYAEAERP